MLLKRPMVVAYRMAGLSYAIISRMLRVPHVALPNLIAGQRLVPELLQREAEPGRISRELLALLDDREHCQMLIARFDEMHRELRCGAAGRAADAVVAVLGRVSEPSP
jgi:lipid-A-disaccharide synthase